jgi:hypothetical protein
MTTEEIREGLSTLFTRIDAPEGERIVFSNTDELHNEGALYKIVSKAQHDSGHGFNFSYTIAEKAVDAVIEAFDNSECKTWAEFVSGDDDGELSDAITAQLPIMNSELALIVSDINSWDRVEEALQGASGTDDCYLANVLTYAWEQSIRDMAQAIMMALEELEKQV